MNISYSLKHSLPLTACADVRNICEPLWRYCNIAYFSYVRIYHDNTYMRLCSHGEWTDYCIEKNHCAIAINRALQQSGNGFLVWARKNEAGSISESVGYLDDDHGISLIATYKNYIEIFTFAAPSENKEIVYFYLHNTEVLKKFSFYFKEKAQNLILLASQKSNRLKLGAVQDFDKYYEVLHTAVEKEFLKNINVKKYYFCFDDEEVVFSAIEVDCLRYLLKGFSVKEIAVLRNVSKRTIETHFEHVKDKLHCATRYVLLKKLLDQHMDKKLWDLIED